MTSITCPVCDRTSHHPDDVANGYCGNCHAFTSPRAKRLDDLSTRRACAALMLILASVEPAQILPGETPPAGVREMLFDGGEVSLRRGSVFYGANGEPIDLPPSEAFAVIASIRESHEQDGGMHRYDDLSTRRGVPVQVSTAYLGVDMSGFGPLPLIWETLVVVGEHESRILDAWRYATQAAAHAGHDRLVEAVRRWLGAFDG